MNNGDGAGLLDVLKVAVVLHPPLSGSTMTRYEAGAQDGAQNSVSNEAHLGPLEPK